MLYHALKIGNLTLEGNLFLAPVAGWSDCVFRTICGAFGASFSYTEMVSAEAVVRGNVKTQELIKRAPINAETELETLIKELSLESDTPLKQKYAVQLFGSDGATMARAARIVLDETGCECIDINAGCPVKKIMKTGAGSALLGDLGRLGALISAIKSEIDPTPVTVKIRLGLDSEHENYLDAAKVALDNGAAAITLHARTAAQGYEGRADWGKLKKLVEYVHSYCKNNLNTSDCSLEKVGRFDTKTLPRFHSTIVKATSSDYNLDPIPIFGSGDLFTAQDIKRMIEETGVAAVMVARGAQGNPFIFSESKALLTAQDKAANPFGQPSFSKEWGLKDRLRVALLEVEMLAREKAERGACVEMRKRFSSYIKGVAGGATLRRRAVEANSVDDYRKILDDASTLG